MSILPPFRFSPVSREHVGPCGPSTPPLELCLDLHGSLHGNVPDNAECPASYVACGPSAPPLELCLDLHAECPATSRSQGSFNWDREKGDFTLEWENLAKFEMWRRDEEHIYSIEMIASSTRAGGRLWSQRQLFVCGREPSGGGTYTKQHPERGRKIETKKS